MGIFSTEEDFSKLLADTFDHLWNGRFRLALANAEKVFQARPDDSDAAICLAWALLENGNPAKALDYANLSVELRSDSVKARVYRAYLLYRLSIFEGAIADLEPSIEKQKEMLAWAYLNKSKSLAGLYKYDEANEALDLALIIDDGKHKTWKELRAWFEKAKGLISSDDASIKNSMARLLEEAGQALKVREYWYSLLVARKILEFTASDEAVLIELESMLFLFQIRPALKKAETLAGKLSKSDRFNNIYTSLKKFNELELEQDIEVRKKKGLSKERQRRTLLSDTPSNRIDAIFYPNELVDVFSLKIFDTEDETVNGKRNYCNQFTRSTINYAIEIIFENLFFNKKEKNFNGLAVWYLNDFEVFRNIFQLNVSKDWDQVIFVQQCNDGKIEWNEGQAKVEIYINKFKVGEKFFVIGKEQISEPLEREIQTQAPEPSKIKFTENKEPIKKETRVVRPLPELLAELNNFTGLTNVKEAVKNFIAYLEFLKERKKLGLKAEDNISINAVFLGNPGTGKTTIARMLGDIFYAMGILQSGHVVEVDRAALVGEYIGQTAQKTEKIINDAIGGVLFIDEAYTLIKKGAGNDFGQEAIDILLKRMEDRKGEFIVIAAGYTDEMNAFMNSNPGLKSRFTHTFVFEDYTPEELFQIFEGLLTKEDYRITDAAKEILMKEYISLYRARDKSFGNARLIRKLFETAKLNLSKICLELTEENRTKEAMTTFTEDVINRSFAKSVSKDVKIPINEEMLSEGLSELDLLIGLNSLKKEIKNMVKLARYLNEQGEDIKKIFTEHVLFLGNPGTGKTTVARIFGKIYSALGILPKGHLVETDRQGLVAGYVGQTAEKTTNMIDRAIGGMLFIDEAYTLIKKGDSGSDFGKEAIDILLKRMEDDRGKFIVIAAGYTDEMQSFVASNPGIQSRFSKSFTFDDYSPTELMDIANRSIQKENKKLDKSAAESLRKHFEELYKARDKKFGNARIVRNILDSVKQKMLLRISEIPASDRTEEKINTIELSDIKEVLNRDVEAKQFDVKGDLLKLQAEIDELNNMVGLTNVKQEIFKLISFAKISRLKKEQGLKSIDRNLHSIFIGNPGTGKKSIARIITKIYRELGVLEKGNLIELDRTEFVAGYQGQSSVKTDKIIQQAVGSTLYVRDAFELAKDDDPFGQEALDMMLKRMTDYRGKFVLILAGTPIDMYKMINGKPELMNYFPNIFNFEDYNPRQLLGITVSIAEKNGYMLDEGAMQEFLDKFNKLYSLREDGFNNGLLAKNILFNAITNQEERIFNIYDNANVDLKTITLEDVEKIIL